MAIKDRSEDCHLSIILRSSVKASLNVTTKLKSREINRFVHFIPQSVRPLIQHFDMDIEDRCRMALNSICCTIKTSTGPSALKEAKQFYRAIAEFANANLSAANFGPLDGNMIDVEAILQKAEEAVFAFTGEDEDETFVEAVSLEQLNQLLEFLDEYSSGVILTVGLEIQDSAA